MTHNHTSDEPFRVEHRNGVYYVYEKDGGDEPLASDRAREEALKTARAVRRRREEDPAVGR
jgi:hypothetical protein